MSYLFFAFLAAACFAVVLILNKLLSKHSIDNKDSMMAYFMLTTFSFNLVLFPFVSFTTLSFEMFELIALLVGGFLIGYYAFYTAIFDTDASSFAPLFQLQAGFVGLLAFLFLGERFPIQNYLWMGLLIFGAVLVSLDEKMSVRSFFNKGIGLVLLMQIFHAFSNLLVGFSLKQLTPIELIFWEYMFIGAAGFLFIILKKPKMNYTTKQITPMVISSYIGSVGVIALFKAFSVNLTISSVIGLLSAPIVFVVSLIASRFSPTFLEHHPTKVYVIRGIGLLVILFGAYKIALG